MTLQDYIWTRWMSKAGIEYKVTGGWFNGGDFVEILRVGSRGTGRSMRVETLLRNYTRISPPASDEQTGGSQ